MLVMTPEFTRAAEHDADRWDIIEAQTWETTDDGGIWDDLGLAEIARGDAEKRNVILGQLVEMTLASLSGYAEIHEFAPDVRLQTMAEVVLRQRSAQYQALLQLRTQRWDDELLENQETLAAIRSAWQLAIWNLEQDQRAKFLEYAELAESLLEEAFLAASCAFEDEAWQQAMQDCALQICGALSVWEEIENVAQYDAEIVETDKFLLAI